MTDRLVRIGLGLAVNVVMARTLGPADFGLFAYALTLAAFFLPLGTLGLERIVVRELARGTVPEGSMLGSITLARLAGGMLGAALAVSVAVLASGSERALTGGLVALIATGNLWQAFDVIDWSFQARRDFKRGTGARLLAFILGAGIKLTVLFVGAGLLTVAVVTLLEMILAAGFQLAFWLRAGGRIAVWKFDAALAVSLVRMSSPLLIGEIAVWIFQKADMLILQQVASDSEVGYYSVAQRLGQAGYFLPVLAVQIFSPMVAQARSEGEALQLVQKVMNGLVLAAYALAVGLMLASGLLVRGLFGDAFTPATVLLVCLAWSNVFVFMGCAHTLYLVNRDAQKLSLRLAWLTAVTSVALNLMLVPWLHARGAALANVGAYCLTTVFGVALFRISRPLLAVNLLALLSPVTLMVAGWRSLTKPSASTPEA